MERAKRLREKLGLTQEAFAERAGLKDKHYQAVEAGPKTNIQFSSLLKMAEACGLEPWELLYFDGDADPSPAVAESSATSMAGKARKTATRAKTRRQSG